MFYLLASAAIICGVLLCIYLLLLFVRILSELRAGIEPHNTLRPFVKSGASKIIQVPVAVAVPLATTSGTVDGNSAVRTEPAATETSVAGASAASATVGNAAASVTETVGTDTGATSTAVANAAASGAVNATVVTPSPSSATTSTSTNAISKLLLVEKNALPSAVRLLAVNGTDLSAAEGTREDFYTLPAGDITLKVQYNSKSKVPAVQLLELKVNLSAGNSYRLIFDGNEDSFKLEQCAV